MRRMQPRARLYRFPRLEGVSSMIELADRVAESLFVIVIVTAILFGIAGRVRRRPSDIARRNAIDPTETTAPLGLGLLADDEPTNEPHSRTH